MPDVMSIRVDYWAAQDGPTGLLELKGIDEFRSDLDATYSSIVRARPGALGGLYNLTIEIVSTFTLAHILRLILDGLAWDYLKEGTKTFALRPLFTAYKKLRGRNGTYADIDTLRLIFQDSIVIIDSMGSDSIASSLEKILNALAQNYEHLRVRSGQSPTEIFIPIFEDPAPDRPSRFRVCVHWDETLPTIGPADYFVYWGLWYDFANTQRVFDVGRKLLIDEPVLTKRQYWAAYEKRGEPSTPTIREPFHSPASEY